MIRKLRTWKMLEHLSKPREEKRLQWVLQFSKETVYTMAYAGEGHIDWGNGDEEDLAKETSFTNISKTYPAGTYTVKITGAIEDIQAGTNSNSKYAVVALEQFNLDSYIGNRATSFNLGVFHGCKNMVLMPGVVLGKNIKSLRYTFRGCSSLTTAPELPDGVTDLNSTFYGCSSLTTAPTLPDGVTVLRYTFYGCTGLTTAPTLPDGVTDLNSTFHGCTGLTSLPSGLIPSGYTGSLSYTFRDCSGITSLPSGLIPSGVTDLSYTFYGCYGLTSLPSGLIPSGYTGSLTSTFYGCSGLTSLPDYLIPSGVTNMALTFYGCSGLTSLPSGLIPSGVTNLTGTFYGCSGLTSLPSGLIPSGYANSMQNVFRGCSGLTSLPSGLIPSGVTSLNNAFRDCIGLLTIPSNIWPSSWVASTATNPAYNIDAEYMFYRSSPVPGKPTGTLPADKLWNAPGTFSNTAFAFSNCTSLSNYSSIPLTWGGPA